MRTCVFRLFLLLQICLLPLLATGQNLKENPYQLSLERDVPLATIAVGAATGGFLLNQSIDDVPLRQLELPAVSDFDQYALRYNSESAVTASDVIAYGALVMPVALLIDKPIREDAVKVGVIFAETILLNQGITDLVKGVIKRPRPYLYDESLLPDRAVDAFDRSSFFSNHTSTTAAASFFAARVYADYHPESSLKPYVWVASASLPAVAGYFRIRGGQHFPTDVIAGYCVGAVIGYAVPLLHRVDDSPRAWTLLPTGGGLLFTYHLN